MSNIEANNSPQSTDELIQNYENKLTQSIAFKSLDSAKKGISPAFTKEELAYLSKKVEDESYQEISVITPSPIISLRKGKTEIQVKNATQILQKIDQKYPKMKITKEEVFEPAPVQGTLADRFKKVVDFDVNDVSERIKNSVEFDTKEITQDIPKKVPVLVQDSPKEQPNIIDQVLSDLKSGGDIKTVNKNAYEIRADVLSMALDFIRWQTERDDNVVGHKPEVVKSDVVIDVATKFYKFVENRR